jgi:hypothetical protein
MNNTFNEDKKDMGITEGDCRNSLFDELKNDKKFKNNIKNNPKLQTEKVSIYIGKEVPVPYRHIYRIVNDFLNLEIMCFDQDIAFFDFFVFSKEKLEKLNDIHINLEIESNKNFNKENIEFINGPENKKDNISINSKFFVFPYVTIEAKMRKKDEPTTDSILATSKKVELIKSVFPHCKSILLIFLPEDSEIPQRVYRCGKPLFDEILGLEFRYENSEIKFEEEKQEKNINTVKEKIEELIIESIEDLQKLSNLNKKGV